jgi:polysaccharide export outer membrane protein
MSMVDSDFVRTGGRQMSLPKQAACLCLALCCAGSPVFHAQAQTSGTDYRLNAGDKIEISVWNEPDLKRDIAIRPDGRFSFPLTGDLQAAGRTVSDVRNELEQRLKNFISEPVVTVTVTDVAGNRVFVIGQVNRPGMFVMNPELSVVQALSLAGGTTAFAKLDSIIVIRRVADNQTVLRFNYDQVSSGRGLEQNVMLESGDVVLVP